MMGVSIPDFISRGCAALLGRPVQDHFRDVIPEIGRHTQIFSKDEREPNSVGFVVGAFDQGFKASEYHYVDGRVVVSYEVHHALDLERSPVRWSIALHQQGGSSGLVLEKIGKTFLRGHFVQSGASLVRRNSLWEYTKEGSGASFPSLLMMASSDSEARSFLAAVEAIRGDHEQGSLSVFTRSYDKRGKSSVRRETDPRTESWRLRRPCCDKI